ncbi:MAG: hypothetical protein JWO86_4690 [Myxococcaceae bacterium]|nr:hypothetical protein [Myxococcaceae bacterium]
MRALRQTTVVFLGLLAAFGVASCGGGVPSIAERNRTFYAYDSASSDLIDLFEQPYPPLDLRAEPPQLTYRGVSVLNGHVHVSRPTEWVLRKASNQPGQRYVEYVSPKEYVFAVYEWPDLPDAPWREVIGRYEERAKASHAELLEQRIPMATWNTQARAYVVRRRVPGAKASYVNTSVELLARSDRRIVLVQIVHQGETVGELTGELLRVVDTLALE